jgi:hypothetical protein
MLCIVLNNYAKDSLVLPALTEKIACAIVIL